MITLALIRSSKGSLRQTVVADLNVLKFGLTVPLISRVRSCSGGEKAATVAARNHSKPIILPSLAPDMSPVLCTFLYKKKTFL
jgi:hypothetical protein